MAKRLPEQRYFEQRRDEFDAHLADLDRQRTLDYLYAVSSLHRPWIESTYLQARADVNELRYRWSAALARYRALGGGGFGRGRPPGSVRPDLGLSRTGTEG